PSFPTRRSSDLGRLRQFNLSLLITDEFMDAVKTGGDWKLAFPARKGIPVKEVIYRDWPVIEPEYETDEQGRVKCEVVTTIKADELWNLIMRSTFDYAGPGFILIDQVNYMNNLWFCENIRASNPCGEQPLPPEGSCLLGSVNLTKFVIDPFTPSARFDWERFRKVVAIFTRMLDNVVEINGLALEGQRREIFHKRRHGMGYLGLGSSMAMLGMAYGDEKSVEFTAEVTKEMAMVGWAEGLELAKEKGPAPVMNELFEITEKHLRQNPYLVTRGY